MAGGPGSSGHPGSGFSAVDPVSASPLSPGSPMPLSGAGVDAGVDDDEHAVVIAAATSRLDARMETAALRSMKPPLAGANSAAKQRSLPSRDDAQRAFHHTVAVLGAELLPHGR